MASRRTEKPPSFERGHAREAAATDRLVEIRRLDPSDQLALVTYDDEVDLLAPLGPVDRDKLDAVIRTIHPRGQANLSGGWLKGMEELRRAPDDAIRRVLLLTDGLANAGITDPEQLVQMTGGAASQGITTTTIGYGADFDEDLLTRMADAGRGGAHYAATPDAAPPIFSSEFEGLASVVAQNVSVEIRPGDPVQMLGVLNEYPSVGVAGGVQVQLGDAYGEETRRVVFALHIPALAALGVAKVADVVIRYATVGEEVALHETMVPVTVNLVSADEAAGPTPDTEVGRPKAQEEARARAEEGDFDAARKLLTDASDELRNGVRDMRRKRRRE